MTRWREQRGQAAIELVAMLPFVAVLALALWQLALAGEAAWLAGSAARAAARAGAVGGNPRAAARRILPGGFERGLRVRVARDGGVTVGIRVPLAVGGGRLATIERRARLD